VAAFPDERQYMLSYLDDNTIQELPRCTTICARR